MSYNVSTGDDDAEPVEQMVCVIRVPDEYSLKCSRKREVARIKYRGIMYSRSTTHIGNSLVLYHPRGDRSLHPIPGSITSILQQGARYELVLRRQKPTFGIPDPFQEYAHFPAKLYFTELESSFERIPLEWGQCPLRTLPMDRFD